MAFFLFKLELLAKDVPEIPEGEWSRLFSKLRRHVTLTSRKHHRLPPFSHDGPLHSRGESKLLSFYSFAQINVLSLPPQIALI